MKSNLLRLVSLLLCLGMILCTVGCGEEAASATKKKKKKIIVKKKAHSASDVSDDIGDDTSDIFDYDDYEEDDDEYYDELVEKQVTSTKTVSNDDKAIEGKRKVVKDYTVNGTPLAYVTTCDSLDSQGTKFRKQQEKVAVFDKDDPALKSYVASLSSNTATMDVDPNTQYQTLQGFGASMTQSSVYNMQIMPAATRDKLMTRLFDPENGIGLSILRQPIGCGDYNYIYYTYDEMPDGSTDYDLSHFDFSKELSCVVNLPTGVTTDTGATSTDIGIVPYIHKAQALNKDMMFVGSVWTAPRWMKTVYSWHSKANDGSAIMLKTDCFETYAKYYIKSLQAFKDNGIDFYMVTPQNELTGVHGIPATYYDSTSIGKLVNYYLADELRNSGLKTKLFAWDFNWFENDTLSNVGIQYGNIDGVAFHFYGGEATVMETVHNMFPDLEIFLTEAAGNSNGGQAGQMFRQMSNMHQCFRYGCSTWILWNICLDDDKSYTNYNGPGGNDGGKYNSVLTTDDHGTQIFAPNTQAYDSNQDMTVYGTGLTEYNPTTKSLVYQMDFYALAHFSKFIHRGAKVIEATDLNAENTFFYNVAALNEDGSAVIVIGNEGMFPANYVINFGDKTIVFKELAGQSLLTLAWDANTYIA